MTFQSRPEQELRPNKHIGFNGCIVRRERTSTIVVLQKQQGQKLNLVDSRQSYIEQRARGAYIATICQPEASFDLSVAAQTTDPSPDDMKRLNNRLIWQKENTARGLTYIALPLKDVKLFIFVDGSFANNKDLSSQIGFVIVLGHEDIDKETSTTRIRGNLVHWSSTKSKRVTRSVLASEIYGMVAGVDIGFSMNQTIELLMRQLNLKPSPIVLCTDSFSLYECIVKLGSTTEKKLMIDVMVLRQMYERRELMEVRWIDGNDNPADAMTKSNCNGALKHLIDTNELHIRTIGWVDRSPSN